MAVITFSQLPPATGLTGAEIFAVSQLLGIPVQETSVGVTLNQIKAFLGGGSTSTVVSMRQLFAAMVVQGVYLIAQAAVPADPTNATNIAWNSAYIMTIADPFVVGFLEPTLSFSGTQMAALFALAMTQPL